MKKWRHGFHWSCLITDYWWGWWHLAEYFFWKSADTGFTDLAWLQISDEAQSAMTLVRLLWIVKAEEKVKVKKKWKWRKSEKGINFQSLSNCCDKLICYFVSGFRFHLTWKKNCQHQSLQPGLVTKYDIAYKKIKKSSVSIFIDRGFHWSCLITDYGWGLAGDDTAQKIVKLFSTRFQIPDRDDNWLVVFL